MIANRGKQIIVRSQFNISGSRGKSVKPFITDYVSRQEACDTSMAYLPSDGVVNPGDGYAFTLDNSAISRAETLRLADVVEGYFLQGDRAIQQMVVSFAPDYLVKQGIVSPDVMILQKGDYQYQYDDIRLRHAVRSGIQALADSEGYRDAQMVACIQHDTLHLHVHIVLYENYPDFSRVRGKEERGVIKPSSLNQFTYEMDRKLTMTKSQVIPNAKRLGIVQQDTKEQTMSPVNDTQLSQLQFWTAWAMQIKEMLAQQEELHEEELVQEEEVVQEETQEHTFYDTQLLDDVFDEVFQDDSLER